MTLDDLTSLVRSAEMGDLPWQRARAWVLDNDAALRRAYQDLNPYTRGRYDVPVDPGWFKFRDGAYAVALLFLTGDGS